MTKKYQKIEFDTTTVAVPEQVSVMDEIAADMGGAADGPRRRGRDGR